MRPKRDYHDDLDLEFQESCPRDFYLYKKFSTSEPDYQEPSPCRWLFQLCRIEHPTISLEPSVLGGIPHLNNTRLSVGQVLSRLYVLGSVQAVAGYYAPYVTEEQIKEAIAYAQDFLELAGEPSEVND